MGVTHDRCIGLAKSGYFQDGHFVNCEDVVASAFNRSPGIYAYPVTYGYVSQRIYFT